MGKVSDPSGALGKEGVMESKRGTFRSLFSVMEQRDDLPEMPLPLAILCILATALFGAVAARLLSPAVEGDPFASQNVAGIFAALPFLPLSVMFYALTILLWRRMASLLATPVTFGAMLLFGARFSDAFALSLAILLISYVFAVSLIGKETRFRRMQSLTLAAAVSFGLCIFARVSLDFGSYTALVDAYMEAVPAMIGRWYSAVFAAADIAIAESSLNEMARELFVMLPAYFGMFCVIFAWAADCLIRRMFTILGCASIFTDESAGTTMPFIYAAVYAGVLLLTLFTPSSSMPLPHVMFKSVLLVMALPCSAVGVRKISDYLEDRLFYLTRERLLTGLLLFLTFSILGMFPFILLTSAIGAISIIKARFKGNGGETRLS